MKNKYFLHDHNNHFHFISLKSPTGSPTLQFFLNHTSFGRKIMTK